MSKTQLKKMMAQMTAGQIADVVLGLYAACPEAKTYLDFFVAPDIDKRLEKARGNIRKEMTRNSRGRNRTRTTKVRRFIKDISSLNPGDEPVAEIMTYAVEMMCGMGSDQWIKTTTQIGLARLLHDTVLYIDGAGLLDEFLSRIERAVDGMKPSRCRADEFKKLLKTELKDTMAML